MKIALFNVCNNYWMRWRATKQFLLRAWEVFCKTNERSELLLDIVTVTCDKQVNESVESCGDHCWAYVLKQDEARSLRKANLLEHGVFTTITRCQEYDWLGLIDCDIIYPPDFFVQIAAQVPTLCFLSGERQHLKDDDTERLLNRVDLPSEEDIAPMLDQLKPEDRKSPWMGWMQVMSFDLVGAIPFDEYTDHEGYDVFDYTTAQRLKQYAKTAEINDKLEVIQDVTIRTTV